MSATQDAAAARPGKLAEQSTTPPRRSTTSSWSPAMLPGGDPASARHEQHAGARGAVPLRNEGFLVESKLGWYAADRLQPPEQLYDLRVVLGPRAWRGSAPAPVLRPSSRAEAVWLVPPAERLADARTVGDHDEQFHAAPGRAATTRWHGSTGMTEGSASSAGPDHPP
jgi:hypothetical protein